MFDNRIFNPDRLGSEEEEKSLEYQGWVILAHVRAQNFVQAIQWVKHTFTHDGTEFNEQNDRFFISFNSDDRAIEIIPDKIKYKDANSGKWESYNLLIESDFFGGCKPYAERKHQELCRMILSKIPKKRGFLVKQGKRFVIK